MVIYLTSTPKQYTTNKLFKMKFLVAVAALLAVAAASENARVKRGLLGLGGHGLLGHAGLGSAVVAGPAGIVTAHGGYAAPAAHLGGASLLAGPAHTSTIVSGPAHAATIVAAPGPSATLLSGPAHGYLAAAPAHGYLAAAPAHGYLAAAPAHGHSGPGAISTHTQTAGVINSPSATLIGPSTDGHPGAIIPKGATALYGYNYAHGHAHGYKAPIWG